MRPRYLEIEGLQSFKDVQRIDFDALGDTGIFGIFGPTGSGKSTVLDAITLALYGNVQRASRGTQGIINTDLEDVRVLFTFDLLRDGSRETYTVERVYRRKKDSEISAENRIARLLRLSGEDEYQVLADKLSDVNSRVEELVGLKLDDFTRSVVLPQNKFQEFLLLEKSRKREMLERIFYLEEYGRELTEKVGSGLNDVREKIAGIRGAISALGDVSEDTLRGAERRMQTAQERKERIQAELKELEIQYNKNREVWDLVRELDTLNNSEQEQMQMADEVNTKRVILDNYEKACDLADTIMKYKETGQRLAVTSSDLEKLESELPGIQEKLIETREAYGRLLVRVEREKPVLIEMRSKLKSAFEMQEEIKGLEERRRELLGEHGVIRKQIEKKNTDIEHIKSEIKDIEDTIAKNKKLASSIKTSPEYRKEIQGGAKLEDEIIQMERDRQDLQERRDRLADGIGKMEQDLHGLTLQREKAQRKLEVLQAEMDKMEAVKPGERSRILEEIGRIRDMGTVIETLAEKNAEFESLNQRLDSLRMESRTLKNGYDDEVDRVAMLGRKREGINGLVDILSQEIEKSTVYILAKNLKEDEPCPVCGSVHHPNPAHYNGEERGDLEARLEKLRDEQKETEEMYREAENRLLIINEQITGCGKQTDQILEDLGYKEAEISTLIQRLPENMKVLNIAGMRQELVQMTAEKQGVLDKLDRWEKRLTEASNDTQTVKEELSQHIIRERTKSTELEMSRTNLQVLENDLKKLTTRISDNKEWYRDFIEKTGVKSAAAELEIIEENEGKIEALNRETEELQEKSKAAREKLEDLNDSQQELSKKLTGIEAEGKGLKEQREKYEQRIRDLVGEGDLNSALEQTEDELESIAQQEKELNSRVREWEEKYNDAKSRRDTLMNQRNIYRENHDREKSRLEKGLTEKGFQNPEQAERCLISREEHDALKADVEVFDRKLRSIAAQKEIVIKKLGGRSITREGWDDIQERYAAKQRERDEGISGYESAKAEYKRTMEGYSAWTKLEEENRKYQRKCDMLEQIQRLLRGNGFIEFISEERLRYIAREASEILGVLTKFRYSLELDPEQGFVICDFSNGGAHRAVASLSGGETFLTSLSLALALSKQIQLKGQSPLEFFFLDEGFGTLDSGLLDLVIDSLERLSTRERVIGLISHVPELRNRISRRLIVEPPTPDGRGSRVSIERI